MKFRLKLKVEAVDILSVKDEGRAESDLIFNNFNRAESPGLHPAIAAFKLTTAERV